jgi:quercetin dioxygenase-like cupin family protein
MYHVRRAEDIAFEEPAAYAPHSPGHRRAAIVGGHVGAVHTGITQCALGPSGTVGEHLHSFEKSFYVLEGRPQLTLDGRTWQLAPDDCGLVPVGVPHAWRTSDGEPCRWIEASAPAPRDSGPPDTFFTGAPAPQGTASELDIRDPRARTFFRLEPGQMELDNLRIGAPVDAPTVSASMATALLAYSGIALKMLVDGRLGAVLHQMFMVEYEPGGAAQLHDHPLEESYTIISGEVDAEADGERFTLHAGDVFWTGVGCIHGFWNNSGGRVRFLETQSPQLPANHSYRFNRDWDYLAERLTDGRPPPTPR